ncbi:MAG: glycosyltransferase involved in cell wall biosynthesis [Verrucomicrobiales bacterium]|jgi:glycosyltransferase involved in cell wall biosynthesis
MSQPRRMLICEEALKNHNGHWFEYNKAVVRMNRDEGVKVDLLAHCEVAPEIVDSLGAEPYFEWTNWDQIYYHPSAWRRYLGILRHNWRVFRAIRRRLRESEPYDLVFVPTVVIFHLIAWWFLATFDRGRKARRIVLLIRNSAASYESEDGAPVFPRSSRILRFVLRRYRKLLASGRVRLTSDSHRLAEEYRQLADVEVTVAPHPCLLLTPRELPERPTAARALTLSLLGPARWEKGVQVLLDALRILKDRSDTPPMRIVLQWPDPVLAPDGEELRLDAEEFRDSPIEIDVIDKSLTSEAYQQLLADSEVVVLPYLRQAYYARISGVAVEAMLMGIPVIYTEDTWNSDMTEQFGGGLGFESENAEDLADALLKSAAGLEGYRSAARGRVPAARAHFSKKNFLEALWGTENSK